MNRLIRIAPVWATLLFAAWAFAGPGPGVSVGSVAPDFTLKNMKGETVNLYEVLKEGPVLIDFWALWCKPCLHALPGTDEISKKYAPKGVTVLTVNTDSPRSTAKVRSYVKSKKFSFEVLLDPNSDMMRLYRFRSIPQLFLVNTDHTIAYSKLGYSPGHEKTVITEIDKVLAGASGNEGTEEG